MSKIFVFKKENVIFEGNFSLIYDISDQLPKHKNYPYGTNAIDPRSERRAVVGKYYDDEDRSIQKVVFHQTAGSYTPGFNGVMNTANFFVTDPKYDAKGNWLGNGRGWPGFAYTFYVPYEPEMHEGKWIIFQCNPLKRISWHTGNGQNEISIAICFQGYFYSEHITRYFPRKGHDGHPSQAQIECAEEFWKLYCMEKLKIGDHEIYGHFDFGKLACPGADLENIVRYYRGEF